MLAHDHNELKREKYVVFVNPDRRYLDCSPGVCELLGYSRDELREKVIDDISYDVSAVPTLFALFQSAGQQQGEFILQHKNRTPIPIHYMSFVFADGCHAAIWHPIEDWRLPYMAALLELNPVKQKRHIERALAEIPKSSGSDRLEQKVRDDAVALLKSLRKRLG